VGPSDRILVWRLRKGDGEACKELIRRHHERVHGYLRRLGADPSSAEDLTQETYARAWRSICTLRESASLRSWLLAIARNEFLQWKRAEGPEVTGELPEGEDPGPGAEGAAARSERDNLLRRAVARLDPALQEVVALHYFQDLSLKEAADVLGVPGGTAKSRLNRALECLRAMLEGGKETDHERQGAEEAVAGHP